MFKPKYIFIFKGMFYFYLFSSEVGCIASGTLHFYSMFSVNAFTGLEIWYDYFGLWLGKPIPG